MIISHSNALFQEKAEYLSKLRIIKKNLIHVHGFPKSIAKTDKLMSYEYFGQYGKIVQATITYKTNPETKKKFYSAYITYSNEKEAAFAILCVDSLLVEGKIIRTFFGTTKYCKYFLNNIKCPILDKCLFLHELATDKDIIIDSNTVFSYEDHINLAKKIIEFSNLKTKNFILKLKKPKNIIFPFLDFIFLSEKDKENYFGPGNIAYSSSNNKSYNNVILNEFIEENDFDLNNTNINFKINFLKNNNKINKSINSLNLNNPNKQKELKNFITHENIPKNIIEPSSIEPIELHRIFNNSINHILKLKPFFSKFKGISLQKLEFEYLKGELKKQGYEIEQLLGDCLDCLKDGAT